MEHQRPEDGFGGSEEREALQREREALQAEREALMAREAKLAETEARLMKEVKEEMRAKLAKEGKARAQEEMPGEASKETTGKETEDPSKTKTSNTAELLIQYIKGLESHQKQFVHWVAEAQDRATHLQRSIEAKPGGQRTDVPYPKFAGAPGEDVGPFLFSLENSLAARLVTEDSVKIAVAIANLSGSALAWAAMVQQGDKKADRWEDFKQALVKQFTRQDLQMHLRDMLAHLRQESSVEAYATEFRTAVMRVAEMSEFDKMFYFIRGLKAQVATAVREKTPTNLSEAMRAAQVFEGAQGLGHRDEELDAAWATRSRGGYGGGPRRPALPSATQLGVSEEEKTRRLTEGTCLKCGKAGHRYFKCSASA
jgi:hypothetical protein